MNSSRFIKSFNLKNMRLDIEYNHFCTIRQPFIDAQVSTKRNGHSLYVPNGVFRNIAVGQNRQVLGHGKRVIYLSFRVFVIETNLTL